MLEHVRKNEDDFFSPVSKRTFQPFSGCAFIAHKQQIHGTGFYDSTAYSILWLDFFVVVLENVVCNGHFPLSLIILAVHFKRLQGVGVVSLWVKLQPAPPSMWAPA